MPERSIYAEMLTDDKGWPLIKFDPEEEYLRVVAAFLQEDVGVFLPICDDILQAMQFIQQGREEEWTWNGDHFLVRVRNDRARITDKYGEEGLDSAPVLIETPLLALIVNAWRRFVSHLPRQREFTNSRSA